MTILEENALNAIARWLPKIANELARANKFEEFRLRKEYASSENTPIIDRIMEVQP